MGSDQPLQHHVNILVQGRLQVFHVEMARLLVALPLRISSDDCKVIDYLSGIELELVVIRVVESGEVREEAIFFEEGSIQLHLNLTIIIIFKAAKKIIEHR